MRNIAIFLTYEGTAYHGWQMQKDLPTGQQTLEKAMEICPAVITGNRDGATCAQYADALMECL